MAQPVLDTTLDNRMIYNISPSPIRPTNHYHSNSSQHNKHTAITVIIHTRHCSPLYLIPTSVSITSALHYYIYYGNLGYVVAVRDLSTYIVKHL